MTMEKYLVEITPEPPSLPATDAMIIHAKAEKENNGNGKKRNKTSNSKRKNNSSKVQFKLTRNKVWEIERVPSTEKKHLWWTKYKLQQNKKRKKSQQQQAEHEAFLADERRSKT